MGKARRSGAPSPRTPSPFGFGQAHRRKQRVADPDRSRRLEQRGRSRGRGRAGGAQCVPKSLETREVRDRLTGRRRREIIVLNELVREVATRLKPLARSRDIELT